MNALGIVSGGLDSLLSIRLIQRMGIEVAAMHFVTGFEAPYLRRWAESGRCDPEVPEAVLRTGAVSLAVDLRKQFLPVLARPAHGYGANLNPCIDCRILMLRLAREKMASLSAGFVFTGEVLGQRPMSQRKSTLDLIARKSGLGDLLLRPLSAGLLPATAPEKAGQVQRSLLGRIQGRSRTRQLELAREMGIDDFSTPAGGCLLTDRAYASRASDLLERRPGRLLRLDDPLLLFVGRHFVLPYGGKAVVGRREQENTVIQSFGATGLLLEAKEVPGPTTLVEGAPPASDIESAARLTARYGKGRSLEKVTIQCMAPDGTLEVLKVPPQPEEGCRIL